MSTPDEEAIAVVRRTLALCRAERDRPHSIAGDVQSQQAINQGWEPVDPDGEPMDLSILLEMKGPRIDFFDQQVITALDEGITQVVICGAGYDDRALRFRTAGVRFFDLDLPGVSADKKGRLATSGVDTSDLTLVPIDFRTDDVATALAASGHDGTKPTLFLAEHLFVFLDRASLVRLLEGLRSVASSGSRLAATLESHAGELDTATVIADFNKAFFGDITPMPSIYTREAFLDMFGSAGWEVEAPDVVSGVPHTETIDTEFVSAIA
ncbi:class I SAM-dependent methyltransferase [Frondihabitans australicus]|uniref:S-adenosyl-L-methionine-dependent methyltransferase n=1 Tax=Frondihabitans australicus TaxID=386892 RepID=A0A495IGF6_9MICO|nr:SAM-dependent methyltransferase [Frondihabitans australicus]RKR74740.1 methyltransferase (TIGR00027 family) [Frondihabitans australicus]